MSVTTQAPPKTTRPPAKSPWIIGPWRDGLFFIGSPLLAVGLAWLLTGTPAEHSRVTVFGHTTSPMDLFLGTWILAHLGAVVFRSHGNADVFARYPLRFTLVPAALFVGMMASPWIAVTVSVVATFWDVYHSGLQTFGIGRIYDARAGNDPTVGRKLDIALNHLMYAGPILAGSVLYDHLIDFEEFASVGGPTWLTDVAYLPIFLGGRPAPWVIAFGVPFVGWYLWSYWKLHRAGYQICWPKVALFASTGITSVLAWGLNSFGEAFFIMNFFHALQYFALVWWVERRNITGRLGLGGFRWGQAAGFAIFVALAGGFGLWAEISPSENDAAYCAVMVVAIMHFWWDGFIWSVRKKDV